MTPLIAITGSRYRRDTKLPGIPLQAVSLSDDYAQGIEHAGGLPLVIPFLESKSALEAMATRVDGVLLSGGEDIDPLLYGDEPQMGLGEITPERDELEIELVRLMRQQRKPVLGICRGMQLMNVAFGGTLYQDLPREWKGKIQHAQRRARNHVSHSVTVAPESRMSSLLFTDPSELLEIRVNSFHHQAVKQIAPGFVPTAWDGEGLIEAMEAGTDEFLLAVQWHPENLWRSYPIFLRLFQGLVEAATQQVLMNTNA